MLLENYIFFSILLKYVQKVEKPGPSKALFTTVSFVLKYVSKPEVVQIYAFWLAWR